MAGKGMSGDELGGAAAGGSETLWERLAAQPRLLADGGLETAMIYEFGLSLPEFASFVLLDHPDGQDALRTYYNRYLALARSRGLPMLLDTPTWRGSASWAEKVGYGAAKLRSATRRAVELVESVRAAAPADQPPVGIGGCLGPRGNAYAKSCGMTAEEAEAYHAVQAETFRSTGIDFVSALTFGTAEEATGVIWACRAVELPVVLSFTLETDACLADGRPLGALIEEVDEATESYATFFMINCAHPVHFAPLLQSGASWTQRIGGIRANASTKSHAELEQLTERDSGDPVDLGRRMRELAARLPNLRMLGGCCGTSPAHVAEMA